MTTALGGALAVLPALGCRRDEGAVRSTDDPRLASVAASIVRSGRTERFTVAPAFLKRFLNVPRDQRTSAGATAMGLTDAEIFGVSAETAR